MDHDQQFGGRWARVIGILLLTHLAAVTAVKYSVDRPEEMLWGSHVALGLAAGALLLSSKRLLGVAFILVLLPHLLWLADWLAWRWAGLHPLEITWYLEDADASIWVATLHHFYLLPLMLLLLRRQTMPAGRTLLATAIVYAGLVVYSHFLLPPAANVNYGHRIVAFAEAGPVAWANQLPVPAYLAIVWAFVLLVFLAPAAMVLAAHTAGVRRTIGGPDEAVAVG